MKIKTDDFRRAVTNVVKGASSNPMIPLTSMVGIHTTEDGNVVFASMDGTNTTLSVVVPVVAEEGSVNVTIGADTFGKITNKLTSEYVTMTEEDDVLVIKANGTYKIPIVTDESGKVRFPIPDTKLGENVAVVNTANIKSIYNINRSALATTFENPFLTGYYIGDETVVTSDANVITFNDVSMGIGTVLLNPRMVSLLTLNSGDEFKYSKIGNTIVFDSPEITVIGKELAGIEDYPISDMVAYLEDSWTSMCKISKSVLISALDRLSIFIDPYDKGGAYFNFGRTGLTVSSRAGSSEEKVQYSESKDFTQFKCLVDIPQMKSQLESFPDEIVEIHYGLDNAVKLVCGNVTKVVCLLEEDQ